jgi:alkylation response protein AidB-like acyl-CoA dehydrogenase
MVIGNETLRDSPEHGELRRSVRRLLNAVADETHLREVMETRPGYDREVWRRLGELGVPGLAIDEEYCGASAGASEWAVVAEEFGRCLYSGPHVSTCFLAAPLLRRSRSAEVKAAHLPAIAHGERTAAVAVADDGRAGSTLVETRATARPGRATSTVNGSKRFVLDGCDADLLLVAARREDDDLGLFAVDASDPGVRRTRPTTLDLTRRIGHLELVDVEGIPVDFAGGDPLAEYAAVHTEAAVLLSMESLGSAQRILEITAEHARTRFQFGRPIGSFQAVKHTCADMLVRLELARSAAEHAVRCSASGSADLGVAVSVAKDHVSEAFLVLAEKAIQVHGGMGFTWEHPAHLYLKRARSNRQLLGSPAQHRERLLEYLDIA